MINNIYEIDYTVISEIVTKLLHITSTEIVSKSKRNRAMYARMIITYELYLQGVTVHDIATKLNRSYVQIHNYVNNYSDTIKSVSIFRRVAKKSHSEFIKKMKYAKN